MKKVIIIAAVILCIGGIAVWTFFNQRSSKVQYNEGYVNGNTGGNLYNSGLFCEHNGVVFFANPDDQMRLYSMNSDGSDVKKICNDIALYINADDHYVYYIRNNRDLSDLDFFSFFTNSLCRITHEGKHTTVLDTQPCLYASLIGNYIYYLKQEEDTKPTTTFKIGIDRKNQKQIKSSYAYTCSTLGQYFYYNGEADGKLYQYDTATDTESLLFDCNCYKPIVTSEDNAYFMDVDNDNRLVHINLSSGLPTTLTEDSVDCYNVYGSYIFYQRFNEKDGNGLYVIKNDGTQQQLIANGNYMNINVTSYYLYFMDYRTHTMFRAPTFDPTMYEEFHPGIDE